LIPLLTVMFNSEGAEAVIVTGPGATQVALPLLLTVAMLELDVVHVSPSATVSSRLDWLSNVAVAVNCTSVGGTVGAVAVAGVTVMLTILGWPAPQPMNKAARAGSRIQGTDLSFIVSP